MSAPETSEGDEAQRETISPSEYALLQWLDEFDRAPDAASRQRLLDAHPELQSLVGCVEALDELATPRRDPDSQRMARVPLGADDVPPESLPREFGRYELLSEIGRGGGGIVFRARQTDLQRIVALKVLLGRQFASEDDLRRFRAEALAAGSVRHPHIVGIHDVGEVNGQPYFTMDYVSGTTLFTRLKAKRLEADEIVPLMTTVARAVQHLHNCQILHRDLKPSNILVDDRGQPYVADFGLACVSGDVTRMTVSGTILGTPGYMPPEQAAGKISLLSPRSDVYGLGAILYEILTGRPPFQEASPLDTLVQVLEGEPTLPVAHNPAVSLPLQWICLRCLEKNPADRYESAEELALDLERFGRGEPTHAGPAGPLDIVKRWARREPGLATRFGVLLLILLVVHLRLWFSDSFPNYPWFLLIAGLWGTVSWLLQRWQADDRWDEAARYAWVVSDHSLMLATFVLAKDPIGLLMIGYPLLIVVSGLFFRVRLVVFSTVVSAVSFTLLSGLRPVIAQPPHYAGFFLAVLLGIGATIAYQVHRVRALSRFYERRPLP